MYVNDRILNQLKLRLGELSRNPFSEALEQLLDKFSTPGRRLIADVLDMLIPHLVEEDFVLKKNYKIVAATSAPFGKWP